MAAAVAAGSYWDGEDTPSVETPLGDFFCSGWCKRCNVVSLPVAVNPAGGFNCYWEMPFRKSARITLENLSDDPLHGYLYQVNYTLTDVPDDAATFHAQWRRSNPLGYMDVHTILKIPLRVSIQRIAICASKGTNSSALKLATAPTHDHRAPAMALLRKRAHTLSTPRSSGGASPPPDSIKLQRANAAKYNNVSGSAAAFILSPPGGFTRG